MSDPAPTDKRETAVSAATTAADACGEIPRPDIIRYNLQRLAAIGYLDRFGGYLHQLGLDRPGVEALLVAPPDAIVERLAEVGRQQGWLEDPTRHLRAAGVGLVVSVGEAGLRHKDIHRPDPSDVMDWYSTLPVEAKLWVGVDPSDPPTLRRAQDLAGHGCFAGCALSPFLVREPLSASVYEPFLDWAAGEQIAVWIHSSAHYRPDVAYDISHPRHLDTVLVRRPELRTLVGHAGWPWTLEYCVLALRFPHVAIELSTFPPRLLSDPAWCLTSLLAQHRALTGKVLFGSGSVFDPSRYAELVRQLDEVGLGQEQQLWQGDGLRRWLGDC